MPFDFDVTNVFGFSVAQLVNLYNGLMPLEFIIYIAIISSAAESFTTDKYCASGSGHVAVNGIYEYHEGSFDDRSVTSGPIFINLTPCDNCGFVVKLYARHSSNSYTYWIGSASQYNSATNALSYSDPYEFRPSDFFTNWQYYNDGWIDDTDLRIVNCNEVCVTGFTMDGLNGIYRWQSFDRSLSGSVYFCEDCVSGTGSYLRPHLDTEGAYQWVIQSSSQSAYCNVGNEPNVSVASEATDCEAWSSLLGGDIVEESRVLIHRCDFTPPTTEPTYPTTSQPPPSSTTSSSTASTSTTFTTSSTASTTPLPTSSFPTQTEAISTLSSLLHTTNEPSSSTLPAVNPSLVAVSPMDTILPTDITRHAIDITSLDSVAGNPIRQSIFSTKLDALHMILMITLIATCLAFVVFVHYHFAFRKGIKESIGSEGNEDGIHQKSPSQASDFVMNSTLGKETHNVQLVMIGSARVTGGHRAANVVPDIHNGEESYGVDLSRVLSEELWGSPRQETSVPVLIPPPPPRATNGLIPPTPPPQATNVFEADGELN